MDLPQGILLELQYLPPVQYFSKFLLHDGVWIEQQEHYQKGTYRNRAHLAGPNGLQRLSVPLVSGKNRQQPIREVEIAYRQKWQRQHWQSIQTAYGNAPFFEFYADRIAPFYQRSYRFLYDFNRELLLTLLDLCGLTIRPAWTKQYREDPGSSVLDFRNAIHPKPRYARPDPFFEAVHYRQVFEEKTGFLPNLSILDLLFCTGPQSIMILEASIRKPKKSNS
jgi:hypothetical protein